MMRYRLGLDIGTNSLGWCALHIQENGQPTGLLDWGVRIFDDGREPAKKEVPGESSAVQRRMARGMRRRYDRVLMRKKATMRMLVRYGLMPEDVSERKKLEALNPLQLRAEALERALTQYEIGRALFHLQQRRGFKSNRKDATKENDAGAIKTASAKLDAELMDYKTLGQFLYARHRKRKNTRVRPTQEGSKIIYDYYPTRAMVEDEFNAIWEAQSKYHPKVMTSEARDAVRKAIFFQRPLKPQEVGKCLLTDDPRMAWAMPSAQAFRIIKEVNNLAIVSRNPGEPNRFLDADQRRQVVDALRLKGSMTFGAIRKLIDAPTGSEFNLAATRDKLLGDKTAEVMRREAHFGKGWDQLTLAQQDAIVEKLLDDRLEDETLVAWLKEECKISTTQAEKVVEASLPSAHTRFGKTVVSAILPLMVERGLQEDKAIREANPAWHHSAHYTGEIMLENLPYYGKLLPQHVVPMKKSGDPMAKEFGRINNPTVHIALNQLRRLVNRLKKRYGCWPQEIVIEMVRELKHGRKEIAEIIKAIENNKKQRDKWRKDIAAEKGIPEEAVSNSDLAKMKLWVELAKDPLHRRCVFSGETINLARLLSDDVEIEHILPRSQTLDNTAANKTLATREANRRKGNKTPYGAFKNETGEYAYDNIWERAQSLPQSKRWRFRQDAMDVFDSKAKTVAAKSLLDGSSVAVETGLESFAARQLNDTSYMAKIAKKYLAYACENGERGVWATPGTLTGLLRKAWGLNALLGDDEEKNRNDHRHHALDALVIAMTTRSMVKSVADASKREEEQGASLVKHIPKPWPSFDWAGLKERFEQITVSHKPDHGSPVQKGGGTSGRLHEDTYYGFIKQKADRKWLLRVKVLLPSLAKDGQGKRLKLKKIFEKISTVIDAHLRDTLINALGSCLNIADGQKLSVAVRQYHGWITGEIVQPEKQKKEEKKKFEKWLDEIEESFDADKFDALLNNFEAPFGKRTVPVRSVRVYEEKTEDVPVKVKTHENGVPWKVAVGGDNQRAEIYVPKSGKKAGEWQIEFIKTFDANQTGFIPRWQRDYPGAELVMTLYKGDVVAYEENGILVVRKIIIIPNSGQIFLVPNHLKKPLTKTPPSITVGGMKERRFRKLCVEIDGSIYDPLGELTTTQVKAAA